MIWKLVYISGQALEELNPLVGLKVGLNVVADSYNPIDSTRNDWENLAQSNNSKFINVEVNCSDKNEGNKSLRNREFRFTEVE